MVAVLNIAISGKQQPSRSFSWQTAAIVGDQ